MGQNDGEIFTRLREIGEGVVRIDEHTQRMDAMPTETEEE